MTHVPFHSRFPRAGIICALALVIAPLLGGCSTIRSWTGRDSDIPDKIDPSKIAVEDLYNNGVDALRDKKYGTAAQNFGQVEQNYPYSTWAVNALLMTGYAQYLMHKYTDSIGTLDRFIQLHPSHRDIAYAYYLRALSYYEQISDIKRDQSDTTKAMAALQEVVNRFPDTDYGRDSKLKIDLCRDHMAGHEMEIGRFYQKQHLYGAAIGRFQIVVDQYQTTNHVAEALHRLTEIYLSLGLPNEARKTAAVLGNNYPGSEWYEDSYNQLFDDHQLKPTEGSPTRPVVPERGFFGRNLGWIF